MAVSCCRYCCCLVLVTFRNSCEFLNAPFVVFCTLSSHLSVTPYTRLHTMVEQTGRQDGRETERERESRSHALTEAETETEDSELAKILLLCLH